jgi:hypothetical protein
MKLKLEKALEDKDAMLNTYKNRVTELTDNRQQEREAILLERQNH